MGAARDATKHLISLNKEGRSPHASSYTLGWWNLEVFTFRGYRRPAYGSRVGFSGYWRDNASHGRASRIADDEAYTVLALLLRFAKYAAEHWDGVLRAGGVEG